jgi:enterobactin synthetase component D
MIGAHLLPTWVAQAIRDVSPRTPDTSELPESLRGAVDRRQRAFAAGRCAASAALASLHGDRRHEVGIGVRGEPQWPSGTVGSITHDAHQARCAAALTRDAIGIGIDLEHRMSNARADGVRSSIADQSELVNGLWPSAMDAATRLTVAFSAKEALYKCLYPQVGRVFDFLDIAVSHVDVPTGRIALRLCGDLSAGWLGGTVVTGRFAVDDTRVATAFLIEP